MNEQASKADVEEVRSSGLFDLKWYLDTNPDVRFSGLDPIEHYLTVGARLGRNPSPDFDTFAYEAANDGVAQAGTNALLHHIRTRRLPVAVDSAKAVLRAHPGFRSNPTAAVAIVIPIYNAPDATAECVRSVTTHTDPSIRVILIDDCSPDPEVERVLGQFSDCANVRVVRNHRNMGYTATVNLGLRLAGRADVVLLNSDTRVTPLWLASLRRAAYSGAAVATATPFSDNAGAFSAPRVNEPNPRPDAMSDDEYARRVTRSSERLYPRVPTGSGYCMYVRRAAIDDIGEFDAVSFPRGYGEENDFCIRATLAGWSHVIDDATLIYHLRSASFGAEREGLVAVGRAIINQRYPDYTAAVRSFLKDGTVERARANVGKAALAAEPSATVRPRVLFVISTTTGGTPQTNGDLMSALQDRYETYLLVCDSRTIHFHVVAGSDTRLLASVTLEKRILPFPHTSDEYEAAVADFLVEYAIEVVHVRHIAWHSLNLPALCKKLGLLVVFSFHDFYTICPTIKLLDENLTYCGGVCTSTTGICRAELWHADDMPRLKHDAVYSWQKMMREMLIHCDRFVTTSRSALAQVRTNYGRLVDDRCHVIPHGRDLTFHSLAPADGEHERPTRILVPGNIGIPKGALLIEELLALNSEGAFEFHILGRTSARERRGLVLHGTYQRDQFSRSVEAIKPRYGLILSIWPETHCHTLTELWSCGLPVVALDFGAIGERMRRHGGGWLVRPGDAKHIYERLLEIVQDRAGYRQQVESVEAWQRGAGRNETSDWMAREYDTLYQGLLCRRRGIVTQVNASI